MDEIFRELSLTSAAKVVMQMHIERFDKSLAIVESKHQTYSVNIST